MSLYMETTQISAEETVAQIQKILGRYGASAIMTEYKQGEVEAVSFKVMVKDTEIPFRLPCRHTAIFNMLVRSRKRVKDEQKFVDQSKRVAWRQILRWIEAQMALIQTNMVKIEEVFMPYIQVGLNETFFDRLESKGIQAIEFRRR